MKKIEQCIDGLDRVSNNTKRRRGRPDVFSRDTEFAADDEYSKGMREGLAKRFNYKPKSRSTTNLYYVLEGMEMAEKILGPKYYKEVFTRTLIHEEPYHQVVLEQLGRMRLQNGFTYMQCVRYVFDAAYYLKSGCTGHEVAAYLRKERNKLRDKPDTFLTTQDKDTINKGDERSVPD